MREIDQLTNCAETITSKTADRFDEILPLLKFGLNSSASLAGEKVGLAGKGDKILPPSSKYDDEIHCLCGGNIFLNGCCAKHSFYRASSSQSESSPASSLKAAGPKEDLFVTMFRDYFGIPAAVELA